MPKHNLPISEITFDLWKTIHAELDQQKVDISKQGTIVNVVWDMDSFTKVDQNRGMILLLRFR